jgi:hypothetical protein
MTLLASASKEEVPSISTQHSRATTPTIATTITTTDATGVAAIATEAETTEITIEAEAETKTETIEITIEAESVIKAKIVIVAAAALAVAAAALAVIAMIVIEIATAATAQSEQAIAISTKPTEEEAAFEATAITRAGAEVRASAHEVAAVQRPAPPL